MAVEIDVQAEIERRTPTSRQLDKSGREVLTTLAVGTLAVPYPIYVRESKGSRVWDVDGNEYIDLTMGFGPHILGHAPDVVVQAVKEAAARGLQWALHNPYQEPLARLIVEACPCAEKVVFCNSGTESTMHGIRAARAFTGRTKIAVFDGCYHGAQDYGLVSVDPNTSLDRPAFLPWGDGVPAETLSTVMMLPFWRDAAFDLIREHKDELALVMVEPVEGGYPGVGHKSWLRELREVCRECGVLILFDEMITGFRLAYGGAQEYFGVVPDLATYGKALGGGMPIGCVAGRADVMEVFDSDPSFELYRSSEDDQDQPGWSNQGEPELASEGKHKPSVWSAGTFSGNPMSMEAGRAQLTYLRDHPKVYEHLSKESARLASEINRFCSAEGIPAIVMQAESIMFMRMQRGEIRTARDDQGSPLKHVDDRFFMNLLNRGVIVPGVHQFHISAAHTHEDVDFVIDAFKQSFLDVKDLLVSD